MKHLFPRAEGMFDHGHDFCFGPAFALAETVIPADVLPHLHSFQGERIIERRLPTHHERTVTAWLGTSAMIGAESLRLSGEMPGILPNLDSEQYHPVTMHWRTPTGNVGWLRLCHWGPVDARAAAGKLIVQGQWLSAAEDRYGTAHRQYIFEIFSPDGTAQIASDYWHMPGLSVHIASNAPAPHVIITEQTSRIIYTIPSTTEAFVLDLEIVEI